MNIRRAKNTDITGISDLLLQVLTVHHNERPDLFKKNCRKYDTEQLELMMTDDSKPIFVAVDDSEQVLGYAFCAVQQHLNDNVLTDIKTLYIDDLCVDETSRGQHIGKNLYNYVLSYAKEIDCYNVTLNVWACNESALKFYEKCGLKPQKIGMECILR